MLLAEQLVGAARERREQRMAWRERRVNVISAACYVAAVAAILVFLPRERDADWALIGTLAVAYLLASRVRFEFANSYGTAEQIVLVPLLLLAPVAYVPVIVALAALASQLPDLANGKWHRDRWLTSVADSWFSIGPVVVIALMAPGEPAFAEAPIYALAFLAQLAGDLAWTTVRDRIVERVPFADRLPFAEIVRNYLGPAKLDAMLAPVAFMVTLASASEPAGLLTLAPLALILGTFSRDRAERYGKTLELQRAYRGTVMLLSDVLEFDDAYTAEHSRSVVDLVHAVAAKLEIDPTERQELEFAALLHDVGKINVPKHILNKPAQLTDEEFEIIKGHTVEGQFMLDRVGGLLGRVGEIVRSCHERWDGRGYPDGLAGEQISLAARIVFACDAYNAMTTNRVYRQAMSREAAVKELAAEAGAQFDPRVAAALIDVVRKLDPEAVGSPADEVRAVLSKRPMISGVGAA